MKKAKFGSLSLWGPLGRDRVKSTNALAMLFCGDFTNRFTSSPYDPAHVMRAISLRAIGLAKYSEKLKDRNAQRVLRHILLNAEHQAAVAPQRTGTYSASTYRLS